MQIYSGLYLPTFYNFSIRINRTTLYIDITESVKHTIKKEFRLFIYYSFVLMYLPSKNELIFKDTLHDRKLNGNLKKKNRKEKDSKREEPNARFIFLSCL